MKRLLVLGTLLSFTFMSCQSMRNGSRNPANVGKKLFQTGLKNVLKDAFSNADEATIMAKLIRGAGGPEKLALEKKAAYSFADIDNTVAKKIIAQITRKKGLVFAGVDFSQFKNKFKGLSKINKSIVLINEATSASVKAGADVFAEGELGTLKKAVTKELQDTNSWNKKVRDEVLQYTSNRRGDKSPFLTEYNGASAKRKAIMESLLQEAYNQIALTRGEFNLLAKYGCNNLDDARLKVLDDILVHMNDMIADFGKKVDDEKFVAFFQDAYVDVVLGKQLDNLDDNQRATALAQFNWACKGLKVKYTKGGKVDADSCNIINVPKGACVD